MRTIIFIAAIILSSTTRAEIPSGYCRVSICNRIKRFSLDPFSHWKDRAGEVCQISIIPSDEAIEGSVLDSESRWYQGSLNPTKRSVTTIKKVLECGPKP